MRFPAVKPIVRRVGSSPAAASMRRASACVTSTIPATATATEKSERADAIGSIARCTAASVAAADLKATPSSFPARSSTARRNGARSRDPRRNVTNAPQNPAVSAWRAR